MLLLGNDAVASLGSLALRLAGVLIDWNYSDGWAVIVGVLASVWVLVIGKFTRLRRLIVAN